MELLKVLGLPQSPLVEFALKSVAGVLLYFALSGLSYLIVFVVFRERLHPSYAVDARANRVAIRLAVLGTVGSVALLMPFNILIAHGYTRIYWHQEGHSHFWLYLSPLLYLVGVETGIYWFHRGMHADFPYRYFHRYHHKWRAPTSWVSMAFHPVDSFVLALPLHLLIFAVPIHGVTFTVIQVFFSVWSVSVHDRVSIVHWRWFNHTDNHTLHHWFYQCNYGQFTTFWDRVMGTWRDPVAAARSGAVPPSIVRKVRVLASTVARPGTVESDTHDAVLE